MPTPPPPLRPSTCRPTAHPLKPTPSSCGPPSGAPGTNASSVQCTRTHRRRSARSTPSLATSTQWPQPNISSSPTSRRLLGTVMLCHIHRYHPLPMSMARAMFLLSKGGGPLTSAWGSIDPTFSSKVKKNVLCKHFLACAIASNVVWTYTTCICVMAVELTLATFFFLHFFDLLTCCMCVGAVLAYRYVLSCAFACMCCSH